MLNHHDDQHIVCCTLTHCHSECSSWRGANVLEVCGSGYGMQGVNLTLYRTCQGGVIHLRAHVYMRVGEHY